MKTRTWHLNEVTAGTRIVVDDIPCGWLMKGLGDTWVIQIYGMKIYADSYEDALARIETHVEGMY